MPTLGLPTTAIKPLRIPLFSTPRAAVPFTGPPVRRSWEGSGRTGSALVHGQSPRRPHCNRTPSRPGGRPRKGSMATFRAEDSDEVDLPVFRVCSSHRCNALRSAQIESPYEAFSTFAPECMAPPPVRMAAPTWKSLYGAYDRFAAARAASITVSRSKAAPFTRVERLPS